MAYPLLICQRYGDGDSWDVSIDRSGVPVASEVVGQEDVAGVEYPFGAVAKPNFRLTFKCDHILASGRRVPINEISRRGAAERNPRGALLGSDLCLSHMFIGKVNFFEVGFAVRSRVNPDYVHQTPSRIFKFVDRAIIAAVLVSVNLGRLRLTLWPLALDLLAGGAHVGQAA